MGKRIQKPTDAQIAAAMRATGGDRTRAAKRLGISRAVLGSRLRERNRRELSTVNLQNAVTFIAEMRQGRRKRRVWRGPTRTTAVISIGDLVADANRFPPGAHLIVIVRAILPEEIRAELPRVLQLAGCLRDPELGQDIIPLPDETAERALRMREDGFVDEHGKHHPPWPRDATGFQHPPLRADGPGGE